MTIVATTYQFHPENSTPQGDWVWVFASNESGKHAKGTAKVARLHFRAENGVKTGPTGRAYAITTYDKNQRLLPFALIQHEVDSFLDYALTRPAENFYVTRIACTQGQLPDKAVAELFSRASANCSLPQAWMPFIVKRKPPTEPQNAISTKETT